MCVSLCVYACVCACARARACLCMCVRVCVWLCVYRCVRVCVCVRPRAPPLCLHRYVCMRACGSGWDGNVELCRKRNQIPNHKFFFISIRPLDVVEALHVCHPHLSLR